MENTKFYVICKNSKKGTAYQALVADLGYTVRTLSFDRALISELTGISLKDLASFPVDTKRLVGTFLLEVK